MSKKIATLTFANSDNYGAVLQAYGLQKAIENEGFETEILNYVCEKVEKPYSLKSLKKNGLKNYIIAFIAYIIKFPRKKSFKKFRTKLNFSSKINNKQLYKYSDHYTKYIVGSDQIWNPNLTDDDKTYFLDFVEQDAKKFSYAASFGISSMQNADKYNTLLSKFSMVSLREESGEKMYRDITGKIAEVVLDPSMLLSVNEWSNLAVKPKEKKYIFVYQMGLAANMLNYAKKLSKETGLELVVAPFPIGKLLFGKYKPGIGPCEWLGYIKNADYIITDSFHGTVFSILFRKNFLVYLSPMVAKMSSRIETLLKPLKLDDRITIDTPNVNINKKINYDEVHDKLNLDINRSKKFLSSILNVKKDINIYDGKKNCSGCSACKTICPVNAIEMKKDNEGFSYPIINEKKCIKCGLCVKTCPLNEEKKVVKNNIVQVLKMRNNNEEVVLTSSSGGIFSSLSEEIILNKGVVYGAVFDKNFVVKHVRVNNKKDLYKFRGSKYVQSDMSNQFEHVGLDLQQGIPVLFSGAGCQCAGLLSYLKNKNISTTNLIVIDFICHGVPSPLIFKDYIKSIENKFDDKITSISFRNKDNGWKKFRLKIVLQNNIYIGEYKSDPYYIMFADHLSLRPSCFNCKFTNTNRVSDITLADYWKVENNEPLIKDDKGLSMILINSKKGEKLINKISDSSIMKEANLENCAQPRLKKPSPMPKIRNSFFNDYSEKGYDYLVNKYGKYTFKKRIIREFIVPVTRKLGLFNFALSFYEKNKSKSNK